MPARGDDAGRREFAYAILGALQFWRQRNLPDARNRVKTLHERRVRLSEVVRVLRSGHGRIEERAFEMHAEARRAFAARLAALGATAEFR